jgi:hypothetical protein
MRWSQIAAVKKYIAALPPDVPCGPVIEPSPLSGPISAQVVQDNLPDGAIVDSPVPTAPSTDKMMIPGLINFPPVAPP